VVVWRAKLYFSLNSIKKACEKYLILKHVSLLKHVLLTCQETHVNLICRLQKISYKPVCRKFHTTHI
jgi:hypothetical protein